MILNINKKKQKIFKYFLFSYILMLLIPLAVGFVLYSKAVFMLEEDTKENNLLLLKQSQGLIDQRLAEIKSLTSEIILNPDVNKVLGLKKIGDANGDIYKLKSVYQELHRYKLSNNFVRDIYVYFKNTNIFITSYGAYIRPDVFNSLFKFGGKNYSELYDQILSKPHNQEFLPVETAEIRKEKIQVLSYLQSFPLGTYNQFSGTIMVMVPESEIKKLLSTINTDGGGWIYIADGNGHIVFSTSGATHKIHPIEITSDKLEGFLVKDISGEQMLISYTTSSHNDWKYVTAIPISAILTRVSYIKRTTLIITGIFLLLGIALSYSFAYFNTKPIKNLIRIIKEYTNEETDTGKNEYDFLKSLISRLVYNNKHLQTEIAGLLPIIEEAFVERLLKGDFSSTQEIEDFLSHIGLVFKGKQYGVFIASIYGNEGFKNENILNELYNIRIKIKEVIEKQIRERHYFYDIDASNIAILICFEENEGKEYKSNYDYIKSIVNKSLLEINNTLNIKTVFAIGNTYNDLMDVSNSFLEAKQALEYGASEEEGNIILFNKVIKESEYYFYPLELELKLIDAVKNGNTEQVKSIMDKIYRENFFNKRLSGTMKKQLLYDIQGSLIKILNQVPSSIRQKSLLKLDNINGDFRRTFNSLAHLCLEIGSKINKQKLHNEDLLIEQIIEYIKTNYINESLCLNSVATYFELTESYLYQFFKSKVSISFSDYLEDLRINQACKLLSETNLSVDEIVFKVGYNNSRTFRRAFKRKEGVIPTVYRNSKSPDILIDADNR